MEIKKLEKVKVKCDIAGCNNFADYTISLKRSIFKGTTDICHSCLNELYSLCGHFVVPQSPPNMLRKKEIEHAK
jgi:hypothetical protein